MDSSYYLFALYVVCLIAAIPIIAAIFMFLVYLVVNALMLIALAVLWLVSKVLNVISWTKKMLGG